MSTAVAIQAAGELQRKRAARAAKREREERLFTVGEIVLVIGASVFAVYRYNNRYIRKDSTAGGGPGGGTTTQSGFNPDALASEIKDKIEGYNIYVYPEVANDILALSNDELAALYVHYNAYYAEEYDTLTQLFDAEWAASWSDDPYQGVVDRLQGQGLNESADCWQYKLLGTRLKLLGLR